MPKSQLRIAAIDIGTNSIHMIVVEVKDREQRLLDREKDMAQLGLASLNGQPLTEAAIERGVSVLKRMADVAKKWEVDEIIAVATSAVREAPNGKEFITRVHESSGINIKVIGGEEEADFIFHAVRAAVEIGDQTALCLDLGGGSAEMIVGTADETFLTRSEPLGALRISQQFHLAGISNEEAIASCRKHVASLLRPVRRKVRHIGIDICVGTSGTILALTTICAGAQESESGGLRTLERKDLSALIPRLAALTAEQRAAEFKVDERRAVSLLGGAIVVLEFMDTFRIESMLACPAAMREGIVLKRMAGMTRSSRRGRSVRHQSVVALARRTNCDMKHAEHVAKLASRIFDQTSGLHQCTTEARQMLEYAAWLHEAGKHVSDRGHHKHTYYLVRHSDLKGFTHEELLVLANLARYYRKGEPSKEHPNFAELTDAQRQTVSRLSAILRIAEGLDRGHRQRVRDVGVRARNGKVEFVVRARSDASVEVRSASKRARYFRDVFQRDVRFQSI
jgi:exopolyphosphatase/guanosine-5'-triphosphate,3'-diphosphate pyrophosphatase